MTKPSVLIALGGNAISKPGMRGTITEQFHATNESMEHVAELVASGYDRIIISHGNGPQVGNVILRSEMASKLVYPLPMDTCVADTQGGMGYMIQQVLRNHLRRRNAIKPVATIMTQTVVDINDPAFKNPTKPIGQFYSKKEAEDLMTARGWEMKADANRGWRRVVPSPTPIEIVEKDTIKALFDAGHIVVTVGGGGIPVGFDSHGDLYGIEAVIDKDLASALVANLVNADILVILTAVENVYVNFGKENQKTLREVKVAELKEYMAAGEFAEGSMKPKIQACLNYIEHGGKKAIITSLEKCLEALDGKTGTVITR